MPTLKDNNYELPDIQKELDKYGVEAVEEVEVVNPVTGNKAVVRIERDGTPESKLILALADKKLDREKKDHILSMYLWERGKESSSFLLDLVRFKGQHTKETRVFKSQIRFDFERTIDSIIVAMFDMSNSLKKHIGVKPEKGEKKEVSIKELIEALWEMEEMFNSVGQKLWKDRADIAKARESEKGGGIYVDKDGVVYSVDDKEEEEIINKIKEDKYAR